MAEYIPDFDYGGELAEKEDNFILWPTTGGRTALIDADLLPYRVGFVTDEIKELEAQSLVKEGHFLKIEDTPQFEEAFDLLCVILNSWVRKAECQSAILYSTKSDDNFRLDIAYSNPYKGQRITKSKPVFFDALKQAMTDKLGCFLAEGNEADDWLSIEAWRRFKEELEPQGVVAGSAQHKELCDCVIVSNDKDSTITPVFNLNPDTMAMQWVDSIGKLEPKYKNAMIKSYEVQGTGEFWKRGAKAGQEKTKRVCVGEEPSKAIEKLRGSGLMFFYSQIITGDAADNYKGLKGKGNTPAVELLSNCKTERELYSTTLNLYKEVYGEGEVWRPHYKGTQDYYSLCMETTGKEPEDWDFWKGKGAFLTAYDLMLEQGRLAWMQTYEGEIWRETKGRVINPHDKEFWYDYPN